MEEPRYAEINGEELREIESELGHPVTREFAYWVIRNRINREAVERMLGAANADPGEMGFHLRNVRDIKRARNRKSISVLKKKTRKKCA